MAAATAKSCCSHSLPRPLVPRLPPLQVTFVSKTTGTSKTAEIGPDDYLLDGADEHRIELNASCRGGVCGTCVSKLRSGRVDMEWLAVLDDGNVLSQEQIQVGRSSGA
jgi:ferredoxin